MNNKEIKKIELIYNITIAIFTMLLGIMIGIDINKEFGLGSKIESNKLIIPNTIIYTDKGVSDTTYIYKIE